MKSSRTVRHPRRRTALTAAALSLVALAGCNGGSPTTPVVPNAGGGTTGTPATSETANSRIQLLDVQPGKSASFLTQPGKELTVVASAASYSPPTPSFRLSVNVGDAVAPKTAYRTQSVAAVEMPFTNRFTDTNEGVMRAQGGPATGMRRLQTVSGPRELGSTDTFWVNTGNSSAAGDVQETAVLKRITEHAYFYVDQKAKAIPDANLERLTSEFESRIYPRVTGAFGTEAKPGIDGDDRLFIVISPAVDNFGADKGLMGYFWSRDALPGNGAHSNQKEALFMTDALWDYPELTSFGTLAHEFQHLINFSHKAVATKYTNVEETWLDEGLSMYAMEAAGYGLPAGDMHIAKDLNEFQKNPAAFSLTDWSGNPHGFAYGQSYLFVRYLVDRFGTGLLKEILDDPEPGQAGLEEVLAKHGASFEGFFRDWTIANLISDKPIAQGTIYQYKNLPLTGDYGGFKLNGFQTTPATQSDLTADLRPWGTAYYTFDASTQQSWQLKLGETGAARLLGAAIVP